MWGHGKVWRLKGCPHLRYAPLLCMQMLGLLDHQRELQEMLRDMPQILPPEGVVAMPEVCVVPEVWRVCLLPSAWREIGVQKFQSAQEVWGGSSSEVCP